MAQQALQIKYKSCLQKQILLPYLKSSFQVQLFPFHLQQEVLFDSNYQFSSKAAPDDPEHHSLWLQGHQGN